MSNHVSRYVIEQLKMGGCDVERIQGAAWGLILVRLVL